MVEPILTDNDVVLKISSWRLAEEFIAALSSVGGQPAMLGVGRFVVSSRLARSGDLTDPAAARSSFDTLLAQLQMVEPTDDELQFAADLEDTARAASLELDGGESQLLAILVGRGFGLLLTGDKRAIIAMASVAPVEARERVACLEQLVIHVLAIHDPPKIRASICAEPKVDRAITACFACASPGTPENDNVLAGLESYIASIAKAAPGILVPAGYFSNTLDEPS